MGKKLFGYWIQGSGVLAGSIIFFSGKSGKVKDGIESVVKGGYKCKKKTEIDDASSSF